MTVHPDANATRCGRARDGAAGRWGRGQADERNAW
jgi:hypothetical protein